jgi:hypothetical protein
MKIKYINKLGLILAGCAIFNASCKKFLDVNTDPNLLPQDKATLQLALPSSEYAIAYVVGNKYAEIGGFLSQYYTQLPSATQYYDYDRYSFDASDADREWGQLYAGALKDLNFIVDKAQSTNDSNYIAVAKILQAYTFQLVSDVHGDVPFAEALQAQSAIIAPKYDLQSIVYDGCEKLLKDAKLYITPPTEKHPGVGEDDVIFHGDMDLWTKFANSLLLKLAMRQAEVRQTKTIEILNSLASANFLTTEEDALIQFTSAKGNQNPLYASIQGLGVDNNVASASIADSLNAWADPRAAAFFNELKFSTSGNINGIEQGAAAENPGGFPANTPNTNMSAKILGAAVPVILMSSWEIGFYLAEAKVRFALTGATTAQEDYETAIADNCTYFGIDPAEIDFTTAPYTWEATNIAQRQQIAIQKWVASCGTQSMEAWIEMRRTNFPELPVSLASQLAAGEKPARIPYPSNEETTNENFPGQKPITLKMWWDN